MKTILMSLILAVSSLALAHEGNPFKSATCSDKAAGAVLQLSQIDNSRNYNIQLTVKGEVVLQDVARVTTIDVYADFKGKQSYTKFFMDELDQTTFRSADHQYQYPQMDCEIQN